MLSNKSELLGIIRLLLGIELIEYEDQIFLAYDNKRRSEEKIKMLREALFLVETSE